MRLFVSIDLPDELVDDVRAVQDELRDADGLNFTDPEQAHVTLKFLGDADEERTDELAAALEAAVEATDVDPFEATVSGLGVFPSLDYISVVWAGVEDGAAEMTRLHEAVEARTVELGFDPESHEFTPHVTLARMEHAGGKELVREVVSERDPSVGTMDVTEIRLTKSELTAEGPVYSTVERVPL